MNRFWGILALLGLFTPARAADPITAASLTQALQHLSLDPDQTYRVRDLDLRRGGISFYFTEGVLSFAVPVGGRRVAAVFSCSDVEAGDGEVLIVPPQATERASLASFTDTPNIDEHLTFAVLFFSDGTDQELLQKIMQGSPRKTPELAARLNAQAEAMLHGTSAQVNTRIVGSLLDEHSPKEGFVYATLAGRSLGPFDLLYEPRSFEPVTIGRLAKSTEGAVFFQPWTAYRPKQAPPYVTPRVAIGDYRIDTSVHPDLSIAAGAEFDYVAPAQSGRVIPLSLSRRMSVSSATVDGHAVEVLGDYDPGVNTSDVDDEFILVTPEPLVADRLYKIQIHYSGTVIHQVADSSFFVSERNLWYPHTNPMSTTFDLTFRCPEQFEIVSTGEPVSEQVQNGERVVHRKTTVPEQLAGFNVGDYKTTTADAGAYRVEGYSDRSAPDDMNGIPRDSAKILQYYTQRWVQLPIHTVALTPIPGKFGQGFPGLIYLARMAYVPEQDRPADLRSPREHAFFSELLLPHELAHQWWGNMITAADYRTDWLMEAMANYSALEYLEETSGKETMNSILEQYREDLDRILYGKRIASLGPVDFGSRLMSTSGIVSWQIIVYEKGTWILHMLRKRLGDQRFHDLQLTLLREYSGKPITNQEFQKVASIFVPAGQPDKTLTTFFDNWVYGTGVPGIKMHHGGATLEVSDVGDDFAADVPMICKSKTGAAAVRWLRIVSGTNSLPSSRDAAACSLPLPMDFLYVPQ